MKVRRDVRAAKAIGEDGLEILVNHEVPPETIRQIANLKEPEQRLKAVRMVNSGMDPKTALAMVTSPENATLTSVERHNEPNYLPEEQMDNEEWLNRMCPDALGRLKFQARFRRDAILYRRTRDARADFRKKTKNAMVSTRGDRPGPLHYKLTAIFDLPHPNDWPACAACGGTGQSPEESRCSMCYGHAYLIKRHR